MSLTTILVLIALLALSVIVYRNAKKRNLPRGDMITLFISVVVILLGIIIGILPLYSAIDSALVEKISVSAVGLAFLSTGSALIADIESRKQYQDHFDQFKDYIQKEEEYKARIKNEEIHCNYFKIIRKI